jgi:RimJ/RimL family protein N-acetyltransferase
MVTFERSQDWPLIKSIVTHPKIWPMASDDFSPAPEAWEPIQDERVLNVIARDADEVLGLWILVPHTKVVWQVHTCLLPSGRGKRGRAAVLKAIEWVWANTECLRIITEVPLYNSAALLFALWAGMDKFGVNPKSFMKNGQLHDVVLLGISKEAACQQH